ncbi:spore germination protein [Peribacillus sp. SCS-26]|uniref:spore germination protein n=1 Tax=Paraperibacillus marinus TaxID=3115295 RepID=UPI003906D3A3
MMVTEKKQQEGSKTDGFTAQAEFASTSIGKNLGLLKNYFHHTSDLKNQTVDACGISCMLIYLDTVADSEKIEKVFLSNLCQAKSEQETADYVASVQTLSTTVVMEAAELLLQGYCLLTMQGRKNVFLFNAGAMIQRKPDEPANEKVIRGSHTGFVEDMNINQRLIRQRNQNRNLVFKSIVKGQATKTKIVVGYIEGRADSAVVDTIIGSIESIDVDMVFSPGFLEEFLDESPFSPFPQFLQTERPDRVMANLTDGKVVVLAEGSPTALIMPVTFFSFFQSPDDYNSRILPGTFYRMLRIISFMTALILPSVYIAIVAFHFEVVPQDLIIPLKLSLNNIPFPPLVEAAIMIFTIELLREAGIRLPNPVGQTIGIVGGLIIGDAVVNAGLISYMMVIIIALTAIASFAIPNVEMSASLRLLTFPLILVSSIFGFLGIMFGIMIVIIHLCKLSNFGFYYFEPISPFKSKQYKDSIFRYPLWKLYGNNKNKESSAGSKGRVENE